MDAFFRNPAEFSERKNLKSAAVSEDRAVPTHESMESAKMFDHLQTRPEEEMISVAKNNLSTHRVKFIRHHGLHGALGADRHENRCFDDSVRSDQAASPSAGKGIGLE